MLRLYHFPNCDTDQSIAMRRAFLILDFKVGKKKAQSSKTKPYTSMPGMRRIITIVANQKKRPPARNANAYLRLC